MCSCIKGIHNTIIIIIKTWHKCLLLINKTTIIEVIILLYVSFSRWFSGKNLGSRGLLSLWFQVRAMWLLIWSSLKTYMVVNFRARGISRGARKLARTPTLINNNNNNIVVCLWRRDKYPPRLVSSRMELVSLSCISITRNLN
jgi:hypothetical protein